MYNKILGVKGLSTTVLRVMRFGKFLPDYLSLKLIKKDLSITLNY